MVIAFDQPEPAEFGFGDLFNLVGEAVIVADAEAGTIQLWNDAATRLFGYARHEAVGMPVSVLVPEDLRADHLAGIGRFARDGTIRLTPPGRPSRCLRFVATGLTFGSS